MKNETSNLEKRKSVYVEGKLAFDEHKRRAYNPYARSNLALAVNWWHGWDTAEEESKGERSPSDKYEQMTQPGYSQP
ncbi:MAG TPA: hypothetical protein VLE49_19515 [Anaerolineales bacterium]|nr:hypothetical protein [Anaerolineales bacterium]